MSGGAITAVVVGLIVGLSILDLALTYFEVLWRRPDRAARTERLESRVMLVLAAASPPAMAYALINGKLLPAMTLALCAYLFFSSYRRDKQRLEREADPAG